MSFQAWFDRGFTDLVPVVPPGAPLSAFAKIRAADLGKVPGRKNGVGEWTGLQDWATVAAQPALYDEWGANVGLRTRHFPAFDIDVEDALAEEIENLVHRTLGRGLVRHRTNSQKLAVVYRTEAPFRRMRLWLKRGEARHLVEVLGDGQQIVIDGVHASGVAILNSQETPHEIPTITVEQASAVLDQIQALCTQRGYECTREGYAQTAVEGTRNVIDQSHHLGDFEAVREAVRSLPNTNEFYPSRESYVKVGCAIKAALADRPADGLALFWEWARKWEGNAGGLNQYDVVAADWERMKPPFAVGAPWLFEEARRHGHQEPVQFPPLPPPPPAPPVSEKPTKVSGTTVFTDAWLAERFIQEHGERVRFCPKLGGWLVWDGCRWAPDQVGWVLERAGIVARTNGVGATGPEKKRLGSETVRGALTAYAATSPAIATPVEAFDQDPWALNTPGGIVNLRTGALEPADPARLFTRATTVTPAPGAPTKWLAFLEEATHGDHDLLRYLQRLAGYALTGSTREHILAFLWGPGGNGKGVFLNTLVRLFGSYAGVAAMDTFTASRFDRHPADLAALFGTRLVTAQETQEGRAWDEAKVKSITGGDPITARLMRQDFFTFTPQFTLLFAGNHRPKISNLDDAMRRRFHLVPFTNTPIIPDADLAGRLQAEWPQILTWAIEGCVAWQQDGLKPPAAVLDATQEYFEQEDVLGRWIADRTEPHSDSAPETRELWTDWQLWCGEKREKPGSERAFIAQLANHGVEKELHPVTRRSVMRGVRLRPYGVTFKSGDMLH